MQGAAASVSLDNSLCRGFAVETGARAWRMVSRFHFALLGASPAALPLVAALAHGDRLSLSAAALTGDLTGSVLAATPGVRLSDRWEGLLEHSGDAVNAVLVAGT